MEKQNDPKWSEDQLTQQEAIAMNDSGIWKEWTNEQIVRFQLFQHRLCMPFSKLHGAMESVLNRPVYTHEFGFRDGLVKEYLGEKPTPSIMEIIELIPKEKRLFITIN